LSPGEALVAGIWYAPFKVAFVVIGGVDCWERERVVFAEELMRGAPCNSAEVLVSVFRRLRGAARCPSDDASRPCLRRVLPVPSDCFPGWTGPEGVGDDGTLERDRRDGF
jgi:hypothetical protein